MYYVRLLIGLCCLAYNIFGGVDPLKSSGSSTPTFFELSILLDEGTITYDEYTELKEAIQNPESNCDLLTLYFDQVKECESIFTIQRMLIAHEIAYELAQDSGHSNRSTGVIKEEHLEAKVRYNYENNGNTYRNGMYQQKWWSVGVGNSTVRSLIHTFSAIRVLGGSGHRSPLFSGKRYLNGIYGSYGNSSYGGISYSVTGESTDKGVVYDRSSLVQFQGDIGLIKVNPLLIAGHLYTSDYSTSHRYVYGGLEVEYNAITPFIYVSPATHGYRVGAKIKRNEKPYRYTLYGVYRSARFEGPHLQGLSYVKDTLWGVLYTAQGEELLVRYTQAYARKQYSITHSGVLVSGGDVEMHRTVVAQKAQWSSIDLGCTLLWKNLAVDGEPRTTISVGNSLSGGVEQLRGSISRYEKSYSGNRYYPLSVSIYRTLKGYFSDGITLTLARIDYRDRTVAVIYKNSVSVTLNPMQIDIDTKLKCQIEGRENVENVTLYIGVTGTL